MNHSVTMLQSPFTFSAKGHTFEGVKERFAAHRGNALISMDDFKKLVVEVVDKKYVTSLLLRNHGHEDAIRKSYEMVRPNGEPNPGCGIPYVWETGHLFLKTKEALDEDKVFTLESYERSLSQHAAVKKLQSEQASAFQV
jgi:hypothetical protein